VGQEETRERERDKFLAKQKREGGGRVENYQMKGNKCIDIEQ